VDTSLEKASGEFGSWVRPDWSHAVASALQRVVGQVLDADGEDFAHAFHRLAASTPSPANVIERRELRARFMEFTLRLGSDFHAMAHRWAAEQCHFRPIESTAHIWFDSSSDPRSLLTVWASAYAAEFRKYHPIPLAWRAARVIERQFAEDLGTAQIARQLGASTSTLVRRFTGSLGLTPVEYRTRVRLVRGFTDLRQQRSKVEDVARTVGFASAKNFNRAARKYARLTPSAVRDLSDTAFQGLLNHELQIDTLTLARRASRAR
jgi:AraC-like DNA-binding protein